MRITGQKGENDTEKSRTLAGVEALVLLEEDGSRVQAEGGWP